MMFEHSLDHIHNRKMLDSLPNVEGEVGKGSMASDGETSDYQRSTPSPQDANAMFPELGEGLEKAGNCSLGLPPSGTTCSVTATEWKANVSPDLGFEDYVDSGSSNGPLRINLTDRELKCSSMCLKVPVLGNMLLSQNNKGNNLQCDINSRLLGLQCGNIGVQSRRFTIGSDNHKDARIIPHQTDCQTSKQVATAKILLNKQLKVEIEKLPRVMTTMVSGPTRKRRASSQLGGGQSIKKRYSPGSPASCNISRAPIQAKQTSKKCPSYQSADHTNTNKIPSRVTKQISVSQPRLLNSFRITKPNKPVSLLSKEESNLGNLPCFPSRSFYKQQGKGVKQCDLISSTPASPPISRKIDNKQVHTSRDISKHKADDPTPHKTVEDINVESEKCLSSQELLTTESQNKDIAVLPRGFRYPTVQARPSAIICKWDNCGATYKSNGQLYDHLKAAHVSSQVGSGDCLKYSCLWLGCKVYGKESSSFCWLEKHVPHHGGKFAYPCIVESCKMRFSSQVMLERHVNSHFRDKSNDNSSSGSLIHNPARKSIEGAPAGKLLKRAGVKLKFRALPFSARIFDFFDLGIMAGIRHQVVAMEEKATLKFNIRNDSIQFTSKAISIRKDKDGRREVRLKWIPENMLVDEWVPLHTAQTTKSVKVCNLPEAAKQRLQQELLLKPVQKKQSRKNKRVEQLSPFL